MTRVSAPGGGGGWGNPFGGFSCRIDGFEAPCSLALQMLGNGSGMPDRNHEQPMSLGHWIDFDDWSNAHDGFPSTGTTFLPHLGITGWGNMFNSLGGEFLIGFENEAHANQVRRALKGFSGDCIAAFLAADLKSPIDVSAQGLTIFSAEYLRSPTDMGKFGLNSGSSPDNEFRSSMFQEWQRHSTTNDVTTQEPYNGRFYMALPNRAFNETDGPFAVSFIHAFMHAAGARARDTHPEARTSTSLSRTQGQRFPHGPPVTQTTYVEVPNVEGQHDLTWMDKKLYDAIIEACTK